MRHAIYSMAEHVRKATDFERGAMDSDEESRRRAEGLLVAVATGLLMAAGIFAIVVGG